MLPFEPVKPDPGLSRRAAIVGVGETDYGTDYRNSKAARDNGNTEYKPPSMEENAVRAFERALADAGLERKDVDGLHVCVPGVTDPKEMATALGLQPRYLSRQWPLMAGVIAPLVVALEKSECDTVAIIYSVGWRSAGAQFGGDTGVGATAGRGPLTYYYFHPWGWSSQAAHWALMAQYYNATYGTKEEDLGSVAVTVRDYAVHNDNAIMRSPMTIDDYMASRYIVRPLHLYDICLVNDGAACYLLRRSDMAQDMPHPPVYVAGWGDTEVHDNKFHYMVKERLRPQLQEAAKRALGMAKLTVDDVGHFMGYDAATIHLINQVEGYGFVEPGEGLAFCKDGQMALGGRIPVNTSGGNLSESYMQGWSFVPEAVRQLRHESGDRQVENVAVSMASVASTDSAHPLVLTRE